MTHNHTKSSFGHRISCSMCPQTSARKPFQALVLMALWDIPLFSLKFHSWHFSFSWGTQTTLWKTLTVTDVGCPTEFLFLNSFLHEVWIIVLSSSLVLQAKPTHAHFPASINVICTSLFALVSLILHLIVLITLIISLRSYRTPPTPLWPQHCP